MRHITIVGGGQAGLVLAVGLLDAGFKVRLAQNRSASEIANGKVLSTQCVFPTARAEERRLGLDLWNEDAPAIAGVRIAVAAPDGSGKAFGFVGRLDAPAQSVDQRVKFSRFMQEIARRGGTIEIAEVGVPELERYAADSDLVVVAAGKGPVSQLFERDAARSPYDAPMRALSVVFANGVKPHDVTCVTANLVPGAGELFMIPALTHSGPCEILFFEGIPGGPLDVFDGKPDADVQLDRIKPLIRQFVPWEYERVADATATDANAGLAGRFAPTVRKGVGTLPSGKPVLGLADSVVLNDPVLGQGSNNAIKAAAIYLDAIVKRADAPFGAAWMNATFEQAFRRVEASTTWTNMMLQPPPRHAVELLARASAKQELADRIAKGFDEPADVLPLFADPARAAAA
jgi:flavin-dependent dehydrogenase